MGYRGEPSPQTPEEDDRDPRHLGIKKNKQGDVYQGFGFQVGGLDKLERCGVEKAFCCLRRTGVQIGAGARRGLVAKAGGGSCSSSSGTGGRPRLRVKFSHSWRSLMEYCVPSLDAESLNGKPHL